MAVPSAPRYSRCKRGHPNPSSLPKGPHLKFGAHRASIFGSTLPAKTSALTMAAKDPVREAHATEFLHKHVRPKILDEEFPEYQALLVNMVIEMNPITLPGLSSMRAAPTSSRLNNRRTRATLYTLREDEMEDT